MMRTRISTLILLSGFVCLAAAETCAEEVKLTLRCDRDHYRVGDTIKFKIVYKNVSDRSIWLLPQTETYPVDVFTIVKVGDSRRSEKLRFGEQSVAWDARARDVVKLQPRSQLSRFIIADIRPRLPSDYEDQRTGIFLILPASAVRLPGAGKYEIRAIFHSSPNHPVNQYLPRGAQLWRGDATSEPITIEISK
jgi:hypothetical protein